MGPIEWIGFCISIFGMYSVVICLRLILPCYIIPNVSSMLNNAGQSLAHAVTTGAIPEMSDYRVDLEILANRFARMRIESHRSPGMFPQIWLAVRHGLACRLYSLASQIGSVMQQIEVVMDEQHLSLHATPQNVVSNSLTRPCWRCCYTYDPYCWSTSRLP
ncbi:hypothetical protein BJY52DRAFT_1245983 [Lactarius psammicola]|nr:hypothetical protein BJY52DRAFT_1245983 [Lactarius psammicola]